MGELKQGSSLHMGQWSESQEKHLRPRVKQLIWGSLNGTRITVFATAIHTPDRDSGPLEGAAAGSWSLGIVGQFQGKGFC